MRTTDDHNPPIARISEGMRVIDHAGDDVGIVKLVRLGHPQAVTIEGQGGGRSPLYTIAGFIGEGELEVPAQLAARLLRNGYPKIDCSGVFAGDAYASADEIAAVNDSTVQLSSDRESLAKES